MVNTTLTSRTENTCLRVELRADNTSGCVFKILPRYKVRSVGDVVSNVYTVLFLLYKHTHSYFTFNVDHVGVSLAAGALQ